MESISNLIKWWLIDYKKTFRFHISYLLSENTTHLFLMLMLMIISIYDAIWLFQKNDVIDKNSFGMQSNVKLIQQIICNL